MQRTGSVLSLGGLAGRHPDQNLPRPRDGSEDENEPTTRDEVCVRSDAGVALRLLRERVLARTRQRLALGEVSVPVFFEPVESESIEVFLSRPISDQNQLAGLIANCARSDLHMAFSDGLAETRELLASASEQAQSTVELVASEFSRRLALLDG